MQNFNPLTRRPMMNPDGMNRETREAASDIGGEAGPIDTSPANEFIARMRAERQANPKPWLRRNPLIAKPIKDNTSLAKPIRAEEQKGYRQPGQPDKPGFNTYGSVRYAQRNPLMR